MPVSNYYRYTFNNRFGLSYVAPLGETDFKIEWSREDEAKLGYKKEMPSRLILTKDAYVSLIRLETSVFRCEFTDVTIERKCGNGWVLWFTGRISLNDGNWDLDRCTVEIKVNDTDPAQCIEDNKSKKINLFDLVAPDMTRTVRLFPDSLTIEYAEYELNRPASIEPCENKDPYWAGPGTPESGGWAAYYQYWHDVHPGGPLYGNKRQCTKRAKWARYTVEVPTGTPPPSGAWVLVGVGAVDKYAKPVSLYKCESTSETGQFVDVYEKTCTVLGEIGSIKTVDNGLHLRDFLPALINNICPGLTVVSDFFQINPTTPSAINYVTGVTSRVDNLIFYQKSDVKRPNVSGNATKLEVTPEEVLNILVVMFNARWRIEGNTFKIEHISYFTKGAGFDLMQPRYAKYVHKMRRYTYDADKIPNREEFKFMEATPGDFAGVPIVYGGACVVVGNGKNVTTYSVDEVTTDVELVINNPDSESSKVDDKGIVVMSSFVSGAELKINTDPPIISAVSSLNNPLSWAALHRDYYRHYRPLKNGILNNAQTSFESVKPTRKGATVTIPLLCSDNFNPDDLINGPLGSGVVSKATYSFKDNTLALDLLYESEIDLEGNEPPLVGNKVFFIAFGRERIIDVIAGAYDAQGHQTIVNVEIVTPPSLGVATILPDKRIKYVPNPGIPAGEVDNLVFRVFDNWGQPSNNGLILFRFF